MYDWNETSSSKDGYIANKTHWKETLPTTQICSGDQYFGSSYASNAVMSRIMYTEKVGQVWAPNNTHQISVNGPTYCEYIINTDTDSANAEISYHLTPVFTHKLPVGSWAAEFPASTVDRTLIDVVAFGERGKCGRRTYYGDDTNGNVKSKWNAVHIKKTDMFETDDEFVAWCQEQLGAIDYENGPTAEQMAKAKEILDTYAYGFAGGWLWVTYDSTSDSNSKMYTCLINPGETYKQYWECKDRYSDIETVDGVQNWYNLKRYSKRATGFTYDYNSKTYKNTAKQGWFAISVFPEVELVWKSGEETPSYMHPSGVSMSSYFTDSSYNYNANGTWADLGQTTGLATYNPVKYHRLDIHYMPDEIRQMMGEIRAYRAATYHEELH